MTFATLVILNFLSLGVAYYVIRWLSGGMIPERLRSDSRQRKG